MLSKRLVLTTLSVIPALAFLLLVSVPLVRADYTWATRIDVAESGSDNVGYSHTVSPYQHGWMVLVMARWKYGSQYIMRSAYIDRNGVFHNDPHIGFTSAAPIDSPDFQCAGASTSTSWYDRYDSRFDADEYIGSYGLERVQYMVQPQSRSYWHNYKLKRNLNGTCCIRSYSSCSGAGCTKTTLLTPPPAPTPTPLSVTTINTSGQCN